MPKKWVMVLLLAVIVLAFGGMIFLPATAGASNGRLIYILPDGSVEPSSAPIQRNGDLYTFVGNVYAEIIVEKDDIILDGRGLKLDMPHNVGTKGGSFAYWTLSGLSNVTIRHMTLGYRHNLVLEDSLFCKVIDTNFSSIRLSGSHNNLISENFYVGHITLQNSVNNTVSYNPNGGVELQNSFYNKILHNRMTDFSMEEALDIRDSSVNLFFGNIISKPGRRWLALSGTSSKNLIVANNITGSFWFQPILKSSGTTRFYHNNFVNYSALYSSDTIGAQNFWDDGEMGNYWSDYEGSDEDGDDIGDTPHVIAENNQDYFPLLQPVDISLEPEPPLPLYDNSLAQAALLTTDFFFASALGIALLTVVVTAALFTRASGNSRRILLIGAIGSVLSAIALLASVLFGFGNYSIQTYGSGYGISGSVSRTSMIFLAISAVGLVLAGCGYRAKNIFSNTKTAKFTFAFHLAAAALLLTTVVFTLSAPLRGSLYWGPSMFRDISAGLIFKDLTFLSFMLLGLLQICLGLNHAKIFATTGKFALATKTMFIVSGIVLILKSVLENSLFIPPIGHMSVFRFFFFSTPTIVASLLFLAAQTLNSAVFLSRRVAKTEK
jgi:hypothetical protein